MTAICIVVGCGSRSNRDKVSFYAVPAETTHRFLTEKNELSKLRRASWIAIIKRNDLTESILKYQKVCSKHFITGKPAALDDKHHPDWVPSQHMGHVSQNVRKRAADVDRKDRLDKRRKLTETEVMDILKAEIARKRKLLDGALLNSQKKYFKRGELIEKEQEEYRKKYYKQIEVNENATKVSKGEEIESDLQHSILPRHEVISRLRDRSEPILLFGEAELDAFKRLRKCELSEPEVNKGFRNDLQEAMDQVDQAYIDELLKAPDDNTNNQKSESSDQDTVKSHEEIREMAKSMGRGNREHDMTVIVYFIQLILKKWNEQLHNRSKEEKAGTKGKLMGATYTQTQEYLKPLLRKLKTFTLPEDISDSLTEIVVHLLNRNYLKASDAYLQMAIGNAPWPIGVTMVGIHARTGREKIFSKNVAHVMNDETQRKYIQALKRLMTKCQEYFPTDPSRCVEYQAFGKPEDKKE